MNKKYFLTLLLFVGLIGRISLFGQCTATISSPQNGYCAGDTATYTISHQSATATYSWSVSGTIPGTIIAGQGTPTITVVWANVELGMTIPADVDCYVWDTTLCPITIYINPYSESITSPLPAAPPGGPAIGFSSGTSTYRNTKNYGSAWAGWYTVTGGTIISTGQSVTWPVDTVTAVVQWDSSATTAQICWNTASPGLYCPSQNCIAVSLSPLPPPTASLSGPTATCTGYTNTYSIPSQPASTYAWTATNGNIVSGQGTSQITVEWTTAGTETVSVTVSNAAGTASDLETVTIDASPVISVSSTAPKAYAGYAPAACVDLIASVPGPPGNFGYTWSNGGSSQTISVCPTTPTTYYVTVENRAQCLAIDSIFVDALDITCSSGKVEICQTNANQTTTTLCVKPALVPGYLTNGAVLGACGACKQIPEASPAVPIAAQVVPNPFSGTCEIALAISQAEVLTVEVFNLQGQAVARLFSGEVQGVQNLRLPYAPKDGGIYFCRISGSHSGNQVLKLLAR